MRKLTAKLVRELEAPPPDKGPRDVPDSLVPGLCLSVKPSGVKSWCVRYRFAGQQRRYTLGRAGKLSVEQARTAARGVLLRVAEGVDPQTEKLQLRAAEVSDAFPDMAKRFVEGYCRPRNRTWIEQARQLGLLLDRSQRKQSVFKPKWTVAAGSLCERWENRNVATITKREIAEAVAAVTERGAPTSANRLHALLTRFFKWLVETGVLDSSPAAALRLPNPERNRKRVLNGRELVAVWDAAGELREPFCSFVRMLILTGARRNTVAGFREAELSNGIWTVPPEPGRSKSDEDHLLPLPPVALELLARLPRHQSGLLFTTDGRNRISGFSKLKQQLDAIIARRNGGQPMPHWVFHDLRRSCATGMSEHLSIPVHVVEAVLNHRSGVMAGVPRTYNRNEFLAEKRDALERWAIYVQGQIMIW